MKKPKSKFVELRLCVVCMERPVSIADARICIVCNKSYDADLKRDSTILGVILWAAKRARNFERKRKQAKQSVKSVRGR